jgi:hypothetical protein
VPLKYQFGNSFYPCFTHGQLLLPNLVNFTGKFIDSQLEKVLFHSNVSCIDASYISEVSDAEKETSLASASWDIDFVAVCGDLQQTLDDNMIATLLGNCSGKILTCCTMQNVRTESFGRMLMFAKLGDWMLGTGTFIQANL